MNREEAVVLVSRLFTAYGKQPNESQIDEWVKAQRRFNYRPDDVSAAIDSLISTSNRMPTIAELRTAVMAVHTQRNTQSGAPAPKPAWLVKSENEWRTEDFKWWKERFGSFAPQVKALISDRVVIPNTSMTEANGDVCSRGDTRMALSIAKLINEMHKENLPFTDRWERLKAHTAGTTYVITPPARVAASTFEDF
jgi:hypothetical protein